MAMSYFISMLFTSRGTCTCITILMSIQNVHAKLITLAYCHSELIDLYK